MIWLGVLGEPYGKYMRLPEENSFGNSVHTVHDAAVGREDDRKRQISLVDKAAVLHYCPTRGLSISAAEPVRLIKLANSRKRHKRRCDARGNCYQAVDTPRPKPLRPRTKVVLRSHEIEQGSNV